MATRLAGGPDDGIERLCCIGAELLDPGYDITAPLHLTGHSGHLSRDLSQQRAGEASAGQAELERAIRELGELASDLQRIASHFAVEA